MTMFLLRSFFYFTNDVFDVLLVFKPQQYINNKQHKLYKCMKTQYILNPKVQQRPSFISVKIVLLQCITLTR